MRAEDKIVASGLWFKCVFIYLGKNKNEIRTVTDISNKSFCIVLRRKIMTDILLHSFNCVTFPRESRQGNTQTFRLKRLGRTLIFFLNIKLVFL